MKKLLLFIWHIPRNLAIFIVRLYQWLFSPDHSFWAKWVFAYGYCKFHPTCSSYTVDALHKYGFMLGSIKGVWRILRCNPWNAGGPDPA